MIACKHCGGQFGKITNTHLKKHNTTPEEYKRSFPGAQMITDEVRASYTARVKGKSYEDIYGPSIAKALKEQRSVDAYRQYENDEQRSLRRKNKWKGYEEIAGTRWSSYQKGAQARGFVFEITIEYAWDLFLKQQRKCAISGMFIDFDMSLDNLRKYGHQSGLASLDRIDSKQGYVVGNVQWVHKLVNRMKMDLQEEDFFRIVKQIYEYKKL